MDRRKIEEITAGIAVFLLFFVSVGGIFAIANGIFRWDLFPPYIEKVLWFIFGSCVVVIVASVLVNIMINISILAINSDISVRLRQKENENGKRSKKA